MTSGWIFDCRRFSIHDGQGLRTALFLKGCPLRCPWCHNPEGLAAGQALLHRGDRCLHCGTCLETCPASALIPAAVGAVAVGTITVDHERCTRCGRCVDACPSAALTFDARLVTSEEAVSELTKDRVFFDVSGGGVTLTGGEPLLQAGFALEVLSRCRREGVRTAVETCLAAPRQHVEEMGRLAEEIFVDLKLSDARRHQEFLAWPLEPILGNLDGLLAAGAMPVVRVPLIPGFTATTENLEGIARILRGFRPRPPVELLNFNPYAEAKYRRLGRPWPFVPGTQRYSEEECAAFRSVMLGAGIEVLDG